MTTPTVAERQAKIDATPPRSSGLRWCVLDNQTAATNHGQYDFVVKFKNLRERGQMRFAVAIYHYYGWDRRKSIFLDSPSMRCLTWEEGLAKAEQLLDENGYL